MIPKVIHYCWFGGNPLPELAQKCIASWRKFFPDYEIKEWNESNFDVNIIPYTAQAYAAKKYAFVSDYARFWVLHREGGIYFDTDVEVIKPMDDIIERGPFMGIEVEAKKVKGAYTMPMVAPGLGLGAEPKMEFYKKILDYYQNQNYVDQNGKPNNITVVEHVTGLLIQSGLKASNELQCVDDIWIYPQDYFNPLNANTGVLKITDNTRCIHWFAKSWCNRRNPLIEKVIQLCHRWFGDNSLAWLKRIFKR